MRMAVAKAVFSTKMARILLICQIEIKIFVCRIKEKSYNMEFRPCIDIHNGRVKQIVGGTLTQDGVSLRTNFVSDRGAAWYADLYRRDGLSGGHVIKLGPGNDHAAREALAAWPGGLQVGGGMTPENAEEWISAGASHVIVTSHVFQGGMIHYGNLDKLRKITGKERLVLDLSCRMKNGSYYIVTDRWQKYTDVILNHGTLDELSSYCDEFLIHAVDVEGKAGGIEEGLVELLGAWSRIPITYAGGVHSFEDLTKLKELGHDKIHVTIGSALDLFGGPMKFEEVLSYI